jgi:hypothetical protein
LVTDTKFNRSFSENTYYEGYKAIRNKIRKYHPDAILDQCFKYLRAPTRDRLEYVKRHPWLIFLLVKWTLLDDDALAVGRPRPDNKEFIALVNQALALEDRVRLPDEFDDLTLFLRSIAYQQFLYQRRASPVIVGRQLLYFADLSDEHYIAQTFQSLTGMHLRTFLMLSQALILAFADAPTRRFIDEKWFSPISSGFAADEVKLFLSLFATSRVEMRERLRALDTSIRERGGQPRNASEYFEQSPFLERPLMRRHKTYECVDVHLLDACVGRFVYKRLRDHDTGTFMGHFGPLFEEYVRKAIVYMNLPFRQEKEVAALVRTKDKPSLIDFVVQDQGSRIFIDAKAVEMHYRSKVTHSMDELAKGLDSSLLKAIKQAHSTMRVLADLGIDGDSTVGSNDFLVVVTESELYISNGVVLASAVGTQTLDELLASNASRPSIPLDRMYFLTIQEFERLAASINAGLFGFAEALLRAREADLQPSTRRMVFDQHLDEWGIRKIAPDYLIEETTNTLHMLANIVKPQATG